MPGDCFSCPRQQNEFIAGQHQRQHWRRLEVETLDELVRNTNDRIYIGFDKHAVAEAVKDGN